ncbi:unnamed protein product [Urochloa decumbens]|uniref:Uncharacterized protein n=1 Tax=Urochloa decumbens TaxID=240449 RepID=A0ABC9C3Z7_9POAL
MAPPSSSTFVLLVLLAVPFLHPTMVAGEANPASSATQGPPKATDPDAYRTYIVFVSPPADAAAMSRGELRRWHEGFLPSLLTESGEKRMVCSYSAVFHGFAARLTEAELAAVAKLPGFLRALPDRERYRRLTTRTPSFLGLSRDAHRLWSDAGYGAGVVIGVVDTGINGQHVSFLDDGVPEPPARWNGTCTGSEVTQCNRKLVGSKSFVGDDDPQDDDEGHGTHVAAIAAGNFVGGASLPGGLGSGTAAGIAPLAHIAAYKVCSDEDVTSVCNDASISCGVEEAVHDGVDVINLSLGSRTNMTLDADPVAIAAFSAMAKGIVVVTAAGNYGPAASTVCNDAPWMLTVGAGSVDRHFDAEAEMEYEIPAGVVGEMLFQDPEGGLGDVHPLVYTDGKDGLGTCRDITDGVAAKMVICKAVGDTEVQDSIISTLKRLGAAGVLLIEDEAHGYTTVLRDYGNYTVIQMNSLEGRALTDYAKTLHPSARVYFNGVVLGVQHSPAVAWFSSRGPSQLSQGLLKPDVLAPGLNIISAASATGVPWTDTWSSRFKVMSGTSMAAPHIAGVAALLKSVHPDWSPAAIKSAILTTADTVDNGGGPILDEQLDDATSFAMGAGHVNATRAADPGLVYDNYGAYVCGLLGEDALKTVTANPSSSCSETGSISQELLNYPTIMVPLRDTPVTVPRTLTNVGPAETYTATVQGPSSMDITVYPDTLVFSEPGEKMAFNITVMVSGGGGGFVEGSLNWVSTNHLVRSAVVAVAGLPGDGI